MNLPNMRLTWKVERHAIRYSVDDYRARRASAPVEGLLWLAVDQSAREMQTRITTEYLTAHADVETDQVTVSLPYSGWATGHTTHEEVRPLRSTFAELWYVAMIPFMGIIEWLFPTETVTVVLSAPVMYSGSVKHTYNRTCTRILDPFITSRLWPDDVRRFEVIEEARMGMAEYGWVPVNRRNA